MLSLLTKIASGYWHVADCRSGYTAIGLKALETIYGGKMYKRSGQPNCLLVWLNGHGFRARDVPMRRCADKALDSRNGGSREEPIGSVRPVAIQLRAASASAPGSTFATCMAAVAATSMQYPRRHGARP
jgi:hypothetical protein